MHTSLYARSVAAELLKIHYYNIHFQNLKRSIYLCLYCKLYPVNVSCSCKLGGTQERRIDLLEFATAEMSCGGGRISEG